MNIYEATSSYGIGVRSISKNFLKSATQAVEVHKVKRDDYYKNLGEVEESGPDGWDKALPFEAMPGPKALPIIGNSWRFLPGIGEFSNISPLEFFAKLKEKYGNTIKLDNIMGKRPMVFLFNLEDMEHMIRNDGVFPIGEGNNSFIYYRTVLRKDKYKGVGGVLTVHGEEWFRVRSVVNPILMQPSVAKQYVSKMNGIASALVKNMKYFSTQNEKKEMPIGFLNELNKWSLESIAIIALNKRLGCLSRNLDLKSDTQRMINVVIRNLDLLYELEMGPPIWKIIPTSAYKEFVEGMDFVTETTYKYIEEGLKEEMDDSIPEHEKSVLHRLAKIDKKTAIAMVTDMLLAGIDTTAKVMGAALYYLAKNPEKQVKLRAELKEHMPQFNSPITPEILANFSYLKAVIKETTRLAPIGTSNLRTSVKDMVLGGYRIPKNTDILSMQLNASLSPDQFKHPLEFIPERWLRDTKDEYSYKTAHSFSSLPFGFGPRSCIGKRLANLELEVGLATIIRNLELSWQHPDMKFEAALLYGIASPLQLTVIPLEK